ncbi:hypothetical protein [uncultured Kordia sp.]|uniref:hypothetical protein n=1 Tax=uncultured Kordia sp. TaxID=507699 RepID=UPI00262F2DB4|nr:hypothetical protein [uncultured Kordia sp.]
MKKRNLKSLKLNKKSISNFNVQRGGALSDSKTDELLCVPPIQTFDAGCSNHMCDSRLGECPTYYCPANTTMCVPNTSFKIPL